MDSAKISLALTGVFLLLTVPEPVSGCRVLFPPSYIEAIDGEAYRQEIDLSAGLRRLAHRYFPDCVVLTRQPAAAEPERDCGDDPSLEFRLYAAGWEELRRNPDCRFPEPWRQLLALPEARRRRCTAKTLYLLGNLQVQEHPEKAYRWYQQLRIAVNRGCPDPQGLAIRSFRTNYFYVRDPVARVRYLALAAAYGAEPPAGSDGDRKSFTGELRDELGTMIRSGPRQFLRDPLTAEVAAMFYPELISELKGPLVCGDWLAMRAFQCGDFDGCRKLLAECPAESPVRLYLEARLARRAGDFRKSAGLFRKWLALYADHGGGMPSPAIGCGGFYDGSSGPALVWRSRRILPGGCRSMTAEIHGQLGALQYYRRMYQEALYSFLLGDAWGDAALVAETRLDLSELRALVDAHAGNPLISEEVNRRLRHLLARRLMRAERFREAGRYFPEELQTAWRDFTGRMAAAEDSALDPEIRAAAWFRLGQIMLKHDIALFGYELLPDYFITDGRFDYYSITRPPQCALPRFHYRIREAGCFRRAAELTSDPTLGFLAHLAGGLVLRDRMPEAAEPFYRQLVRRNFSPYSERLDLRRWIPAPPRGWKARIIACDFSDSDEAAGLIKFLLAGAVEPEFE